MNTKKVNILPLGYVTLREIAIETCNPGLICIHPCKIWSGQTPNPMGEIASFKDNVYGVRAIFATLRNLGEYAGCAEVVDYIIDYADHADINIQDVQQIAIKMMSHSIYEIANPDTDQIPVVKAIVTSNLGKQPWPDTFYRKALLLSRRS